MPSPPDTVPSSVQDLFPVVTDSPDATQALGGTLADRLPPGSVVALYGDLGTGKTRLVKGIAEGLGLSPTGVRSPTFTILHTYDEDRRPLHHFDAYRVQSPDEFVELGFEEYVSDETGLTCIEWADRVDSLLPPDALRLALTHEAPHRRRIALHTPAPT
ncbi:MAG: tRNA (adenosine(37)-N6)-threonylcarbamoyltransferase complex ATPase subunit type 1 TsaE [Bacteroidetes bacterium SW_9_63_38]|nr:MAG: tRNA (adenosine(37)-N6)-threonylcarbamoyltransferase complex ATPase subunit type 1 TsaE [Bacteroidetes bacterium SW_9_63_38]